MEVRKQIRVNASKFQDSRVASPRRLRTASASRPYPRTTHFHFLAGGSRRRNSEEAKKYSLSFISAARHF